MTLYTSRTGGIGPGYHRKTAIADGEVQHEHERQQERLSACRAIVVKVMNLHYCDLTINEVVNLVLPLMP